MQIEGEPIALRRILGPASATLVIVANMVGTGIFTTSGYILMQVGRPGLLLICWVLGGLIALTGAFSYAELGARFPRSGGEYVFLRESYGSLWGFLSGWISLVVGFSAPIAAAAVAAAAYLQGLLPVVPDWPVELGPWTWVLSGETLTALLLLLFMTWLHGASLRVGIRVQNLLTLLKLLILTSLIVAGLTHSGKGVSLFQGLSDSGKLAERMATALVFISFSYSGFNAATYLGGEIRNPRRNIPLALMVGTGLVMLLYVLVNLAYLAAVPSSQLSGVKEIGAIAAQALLGQKAAGLFNVLVAVCLLSSLGAMLLTGPRVYCAMAGDGLFPGTLGRLRSRSGVPSNAVRLQAGIAALMILTASFETLLFYIGFTLSLFAALSVSGLMVLRHRLGPPASFRTPFYPWAPLLFIAANAWIIIFSLAGNPWRALPAAITLAVGVVLYKILTRPKMGKSMHTPPAPVSRINR